MSKAEPGGKPLFNLLVARQLDDMSTGNNAFLMVLLRAVTRAGMDIRIVFAPRRSFGNRPWMTLHPEFMKAVPAFVCTGAMRVGRTFVSLSPSVWGRFFTRLYKEAARRLGKTVEIRSLLAHPLDDSEAAALAAACDRKPGAVVVAEYSNLARALPLLRRQNHRGAFLHDLFSVRAEAFRARGDAPDQYDLTLAEEAASVASANFHIYASANEAALLAPLVPSATPLWLRPEVPEYPALSPSALPAAAARAVFLGTRHAGNTDALHHLVDDIWPRVRTRCPHAELWVAGSTCSDLTPAQASAPGVRPLGRVADLSSIGGPFSIGLAPTRLASGISIKVAEYLRLGMPCVAYPVALEGFGAELDDLVDVVATPEAFADRVAALLGDRQARNSRGVRGYNLAPARLDNRQVVDYLRGVSQAAAPNLAPAPVFQDGARAGSDKLASEPDAGADSHGQILRADHV